ncbi:MAG: class IV adenylate cyclase [Candidatus Thermoplasmatota archaeon]|nr:class IV adenylate cyclase [Candidatus Thermoplasmatota archaeon]
MIEVEMKSPVEMTKDPVRMEAICSTLMRRLITLGADPKGSVVQSDIYLVHPCRDLASTDESLRIRSEVKDGSESLKLTYKGPKLSGRSKSRKEIELSFSQGCSLAQAVDLFGSMGFDSLRTINKTRHILEMDGVVLCVDSVEGLGVFLEGEIMSETLEEAEGKVITLMGSLGYSTFERRSYLELILGG